MLGIFERLNAHGRTVVMITHEDDVAAHARRLIRLADGRIVADGEIGEVEAAAAEARPRLARSV